MFFIFRILFYSFNFENYILSSQAVAGGGGSSIIAREEYVTFLQELTGAEVKTDEKESFLQLTRMFGDTNTMVPVLDRGLNGKENRLIVRDFYDRMSDDILDSIASERIYRVYVTGTPGTGKSTFRNYFAWKILQKFKGKGEAVRIAMHKGGKDSFFLLCLESDGSIRVEYWKMDQLQEYGMEFTLGDNFFGLSDVSEGNAGQCDVFTGGSIIFSSPNGKTWQQGEKANCIFYYMPCWEEEELCSDDPTGKFKKRFQKYGGVARVVWGSEQDVKVHEDRLKKKLALNFSELQSEVESGAIDSKSHRFVHLDVKKVGNDYQFNQLPTLTIPTRYMANLIAKKYVDQILNSANNVFNLQHASVHGILFEAVALELIAKHADQCVFHIHRSTPRCQFPLLDGNLLEIPEGLETVKFDAEGFVEAITKPNVLALPHSDYFPGFDGAISFQDADSKNNYLALLQMTTADEHPLSLTGLNILAQAQKTKMFNKIIIIYVLPNKKVLKSFGLQGLKGSGGTDESKTIFANTSQVAMSITIKSEGDARKKAKTDGAEEGE